MPLIDFPTLVVTIVAIKWNLKSNPSIDSGILEPAPVEKSIPVSWPLACTGCMAYTAYFEVSGDIPRRNLIVFLITSGSVAPHGQEESAHVPVSWNKDILHLFQRPFIPTPLIFTQDSVGLEQLRTRRSVSVLLSQIDVSSPSFFERGCPLFYEFSTGSQSNFHFNLSAGKPSCLPYYRLMGILAPYLYQ